jgi:hypothetical protein
MANATKGAFLIDSQNCTYWSSTGKPTESKTEESKSSSSSYKVEEYSGALNRADEIPRKPVAAMAYGQRVRIARIYQGFEEFIGKEIRVGGWAKSTRAQSKEFCFVELNDGSCFGNLQVIINKTLGDSFADISKAIVGASFMFTGTLIKSPAKGQDFELQVKDATIHTGKVCGHSDGTYPIQGRPSMDVSISVCFNHSFI